MQAPTLLQIITLRGHTFLPPPLGKDSVVVDLGANRGDFTRQVRARYGCRVVAVEANPALAPLVQERVGGEGVTVLNAAAVGVDGPVTFHLSDNIEASTVLGEKGTERNGQVVTVPGLSLATLFREQGLTRVDLLKMDIEGAEVAVLMQTPGAVLAAIDQITLEFHDFCGLTTHAEIRAVVGRLESLGFDGYRFGNDNINWLFARRGLKGVGPLRRWYATGLVRGVRNIFHRARALVGAPNLGLSDTLPS